MKNISSKSKTSWREQGETPDYRFSLANERTYLAWVRTALALLAGAVAIDQLAPELANPTIRIILSLFLCLASGGLSLFAYKRWAANERRMRNNEALNYTRFLALISIGMLLLTSFVILAIIS
ncbi:DUF202 domain-containing protein [Vibrio mediterranei]|jgi:putative membrane protein|uniref:YidH family protein n=1 Tax=Vibrio mediterranei TaxID=689 RepID=UPI001EFE60D0|nr:DUF202 domain-containing protein [Vibrio mediterranei]MCG9627745.1 DUF202 domain-containing protein [Vibrio mediterranei]MCY9855086.1 DUF202 domain-containing protein [Vibrio mediterranei]